MLSNGNFAQQRFEFQLLDLALELLRAPLGLLLQFLDGPLHRHDGLVLLQHLLLQGVLRVLERLAAHRVETLGDPLLDREIEFAPRIVQLALLLEELRLGRLGLGELRAARLQDTPQVGEFTRLRFELGGAFDPGLLRFLGGKPRALRLELRRDLGVLVGEALLELEPGGGDERCGQGFGQADFAAALRTGDGGLRHVALLPSLVHPIGAAGRGASPNPPRAIRACSMAALTFGLSNASSSAEWR